MRSYFCTGSYTEPILFGTGQVFEGKGTGVSICSFEDGKIELISEAAVRNPSFVCMDEERKRIYAVNEMKEYLDAFGGGVTMLSYDEKGNMEVLDTLNTGGTDPCHIIISPSKDHLSIANFASGSVTVVPLGEDGSMKHDTVVFRHSGSSADPNRQTGPHAHSSIFTPDGKYMLVPDLGIDKVKVYRCVEGGLMPCPEKDISVTPGSGPRFGEFSPDGRFFYLINEIGCRIGAYRYEAGSFTPEGEISTLPEGFKGDSICADLHLTPNGKLLYGSNRGEDTLLCCHVEEDGRLRAAGRTPCGGMTPRNFAIDPSGKYVLCALQDSDVINVFAIAEDGSLEMVSSYDTGSPVCIRFFENSSF